MIDKPVGVPPILYPKNAEIFAYSLFEMVEFRPSRFIKNLTIRARGDSPSPFTCPRCNEKLPGLGHGEDITCPECNLRMQLYGNGLHIWEATGEGG